VRRQPHWYHTYRFDNGFEVGGDYDIGLNIDEYGFPRDMSGMKVLDIGSASGWFSLFFEQRGAEVTSVDAASVLDLDRFGDYERRSEPPRTPDAYGDDGRPLYFNDVSRGLWIMRELLGSKIRLVNGTVYEVSPELLRGESFDLVFMGAVLLHLRDPMGAIRAARSVCRGRMLATNWLMPDANGYRIADLPCLGEQEFLAWWRPTRECYALWFKAAGFRHVDVERTVTLTGGEPRQRHYPSDDPANPTQLLGLAEAHV